MELILDGVPFKQNINAGNIVCAVENYLKKQLKESKVLISCRINQVDLDAEQPLEALRINLRSGNVETVEIITQDKSTLVNDTIKTGLDYTPKLIIATHQLATDINTGKGFNKELWQNVTKGLEWLVSICVLVDPYLNSLPGIEESPGEVVQSLNKILIETVEAMAVDDIVTVADLLEYELSEKQEQIMRIFKAYISESKPTIMC